MNGSPARRAFLRSVARWPSALLVALATASGTVATAFIALVVEDWTLLDEPGSGPIWGTSPVRFACAVGSLLALVLLLWVLSHQRRLRGTFYYVRLLDSGVEDRHYLRALEKARKYGDFMSVSRRRALGRDHVVDLTAVVQEISDALEDATNSDQSATGFTIAPNLYMPAAIAVGYDWLAPNFSLVAEINPPGGTGPAEFDIELNDCLAAYRSAEGEHHQALPRGLVLVAGDPGSLRDPPVVWVEPLLTGVAVPVVGLEMPGNFGCADLHLVFGTIAGNASQPADMARPGIAAESAGRLAAALRWVAGTYPTATIVLSGRLSKAVAFATGWTLGATLHNSMSTAERYIWPRLVILHVFDPAAPVARAVRVNDEQPNLLDVLRRPGTDS